MLCPAMQDFSCILRNLICCYLYRMVLGVVRHLDHAQGIRDALAIKGGMHRRLYPQQGCGIGAAPPPVVCLVYSLVCHYNTTTLEKNAEWMMNKL